MQDGVFPAMECETGKARITGRMDVDEGVSQRDVHRRVTGFPMTPLKFEDALSRLETIVTELEKGDLPLSDSLKIFEEGIKLSKNCLKMLDDAERKVAIMVQDKNGQKRLEAYSVDENTDERNLPS